MPVEVIKNLEEFQKAVGSEGGSGPIAIIDFWAHWCGPCTAISPVFHQLAERETTGKVKFYSVDVDAAPDVAAACKITAMPTFLAFKNGTVIQSMKGANPPSLTKIVQDCIAA
ncbi:hypothetical protein CROQUDRAFT_137068 [Cronartium quercuum f. sp. fusiforme G11]|uniref:Thioredoxin n=1 Tax=Cronartium quercuum f. sp. fusiforme G11 TaxID=708437 RepID=A0A9P6N8C8_9BASI|nr:hypothetical protein CROQUDRAFT_137068 [Cronartium quercuum f. sp. fusiforme G11]